MFLMNIFNFSVLSMFLMNIFLNYYCELTTKSLGRKSLGLLPGKVIVLIVIGLTASIFTDEMIISMSNFTETKFQKKYSCFHPLPKSLNLPKKDENISHPIINLGFPKIGSSTLHAYFGCGGYTSLHYRCTQTTACSQCIRNSIESGLPAFAKSGRSDAYMQIDSGEDLPQIEFLDELVNSYSHTTFILTFRSMEGVEIWCQINLLLTIIH